MNCLTADKSSLRAKPPLEQLTSGMVNAVRCQITFGEDWTGLTKIAVFSNGRASVDVPEMEWEENVIPIPPEMTARPGVTVRLGIYGTDGGSVVLPTVWCSLGSVQVGADPSGAANLQPKAPVWEQVLARQNTLETALGDITLPYTTLSRAKHGQLTIHCHNLLPGERYALHLYTVSRRRGAVQKSWRHPVNYDFVEESSKETRKGYGNLVDRPFAYEKGGIAKYPTPPSWMPNGGYLQTEWELPVAPDSTLFFKLDLSTWLLPMMKTKVFSGEHAWKSLELIGIGSQDRAPLLMRWHVVRLKDGAVGTCRQILRVGVAKIEGQALELRLEAGHIEGLYTSII